MTVIGSAGDRMEYPYSSLVTSGAASTAVMSLKIRRRVATVVAGSYALLVTAVAIDAWIGLQTDPSGLTALGLVVVTLPSGPACVDLTNLLVGDAAEGLKPALPVLLMTAGGLFQAWSLWLLTRVRRTG